MVKEGEVQARFFAVLRLMSSARDEFEQLAQRALSLLENPRPAIRSVAEAIILDLCPTDQGWSISVDQKSVPRLLSLHGPDWKQVVLGIPTEIWGGIGTSMLNNLVPVVTGLDLDAIGSVGGAKVINSETGAPVWEWPPPSALEGHCLGCHRRDSLRHMPGGFYECTICGNRQDNAGLWVSTLT